MTFEKLCLTYYKICTFLGTTGSKKLVHLEYLVVKHTFPTK